MTAWKIDATPQQICIMQGNLCIADCGIGAGAYDHAAAIVKEHNESTTIRALNAELLATLQNLVAAIGPRDNPIAQDCAKQARAAIAKATE